MFIEDLCRIIIPLFLQQHSSFHYTVICLPVYFPEFQEHAVVLHNTVPNYNGRLSKDGVCVCVFVFVCSDHKKAGFLNIISRELL